LRILSKGKALGKGAHDAEWLAELRQLEGLAGNDVEESQLPFEDPAGSGHAGLRELGGEDRLAACFCAGEVLPVRQRADAALIDRGVAADRDADGVDHLL